MSSATRVPLAEAAVIAQRLIVELFPTCHRIVVAGSIRRGSSTVGDIDLVCEPVVTDELDLFDLPTGNTRDALHDRCDELLRTSGGLFLRRFDKNDRPTWGHGLKRAIYEGLNVDIQAVRDASTWGFWLLVRTGPAEFNKRIVTPRSKGGLLPPGFEVRDGFRLYRHGGLVPTPREEDVFEALGLAYVAPEHRATHAQQADGRREDDWR